MTARPSTPARGLLGALVLAVTLVLCAAAFTAFAGEARGAAAARQASLPPLGGVNVAGLYIGATLNAADEEIAQARLLHAKVVRAELRWSTLEPSAPGQIDPGALAFTDRLVGDAAAAGIKVILTVDSTPCWASTAPAPLLAACVPSAQTPANSWPPSDPADYAAVVGFIAARYGTELAAIEIWNEPDHVNQAYFAGPEKAQRYAAILRAAYPAIKQANPQVQVLAGSLVGSNGVFLRALYAAGIKGYYDGLAVHYYDLALASVRAIHEVQLANGDTTPLWLDEFGWSSCYPKMKIQEEQACVTPAVQAANITDLYRSLARTPYVAAVVVYNLREGGGEHFGMLSSSGARKPAFRALSAVLSSPFESPRPVTLTLVRRAGRVRASGSGPVGDFMELEAYVAGVLRYRALFTLDRFDRYSITLPAVLGTRKVRVHTYQYWAGSTKGPWRSI